MTKKEYKLNLLSSALFGIKLICDKLTCSPSLKEKAEALYKEVQKEYKRLNDETL